MEERFLIQNNQYVFPYHYIPYYKNNAFKMSRELSWGGEYLAYQRYVCEKIMDLKANSILDVGCGDGRLCNILNEYGNGLFKLKGIDLSKEAIAWASLFNPEIDFEVKDIAFENEKWDVITAIEVIEHIPDDKLGVFFRNIKGCLADNGRLIITVPSSNLPVSKKHYRHYTLELLESQLCETDCGLVIEEGEYIVPLMSRLDNLTRRFLINRFWKLWCYEKWEWKRLWKKGLVTDSQNGAHCFAIIKHADK